MEYFFARPSLRFPYREYLEFIQNLFSFSKVQQMPLHWFIVFGSNSMFTPNVGLQMRRSTEYFVAVMANVSLRFGIIFSRIRVHSIVSEHIVALHE